MPISSPVFQDVTTINYTLEWPHLENPSNTTFAGPTQIDICRCGPLTTDLGHIYTRYRCHLPQIRFTSPNEELWVLQAPLSQVNLLRPANTEEIQRRKEIEESADPGVYAGKNFLLLTGPCPRGRYQAYATLQFLMSLNPLARQKVEYLSLLIQPYEEDCCDDQGGRAYLALARYIVTELPAFKTLCLNIWGEETRVGSREFAMVLWKDGITITLCWDWGSGETEEYSDVTAFLIGIETGVVVKRPVWEDGGDDDGNECLEEGHTDEVDEGHSVKSFERTSNSRQSSRDRYRRNERANATWEEVSSTEEDTEKNPVMVPEQDEETRHEPFNHDIEDEAGPIPSLGIGCDQSEQDSSEDDWSDTMWTPLSPHGVNRDENGSWQVL
jgi:hypothetical protein